MAFKYQQQEWEGWEPITYQNGDQRFVLAVSYRNRESFEQFRKQFYQNVAAGEAFLKAADEDAGQQYQVAPEDFAQDNSQGAQGPDPTANDLEIRIAYLDDSDDQREPRPIRIDFAFGRMVLGSQHYFNTRTTSAHVSVNSSGNASATLWPGGVNVFGGGSLDYPPSGSLRYTVLFRVVVTGASGTWYELSGSYIGVNSVL